MPSTLIVSGCEGSGSERYRVFHRREQLELQGLTCSIISCSQLESACRSLRAIRELIEPADIVLLHRTAYGDLIGDLLGEIAAQRKPAVFDLDDLVFEPGMTHFHRCVELLSRSEREHYDFGVRRYLEMLEHCDYFIGATDYLAELARVRGRIAYVDRNCLSLRFIAGAAAARRWLSKPSDKVVIGYSSGTHTHNHDFLEAADALVEILQSCPQVHLSIMGPLDLDDRFSSFADRIEKIPLIGWEQVPEVIARWDIDLAPLEIDNPFCRSKSELKYFEAGILGVPTVASNIEAYAHAIKDGHNGFLCRSKDEWYRALRMLVDDPVLRQRIGHEAELHSIAKYTPRHRSEGFVALLAAIIDNHRRRPASSLAAQTKSSGSHPRGLEIGWVVPVPMAGSGGHNGIIRYANMLQKLGHNCTLYFDGGGRFTDSEDLAVFVRKECVGTEATIRLGYDSIANCDALIATHWSTVSVVQASDCGARKLYFVQDFEPYFCQMSTEWILAEETYRLGLRCITHGRWLTDWLRRRYDADADYIDFAVDTSIYYPRAVTQSDPPIVCAVAQPEKARRGFDLLVHALTRVHQLCPQVKIVLFGSPHIPAQLPFPFENAGLLNLDQCAELYSRATAGIILSMSNPSLIGFEMMACGCAVVDLDLENNCFDYGQGGALILARPDPDSLAGAVVRLVNDPERRSEIAVEGRRHVLARSYELSARRFEQHILRGTHDRQETRSRDIFQLRHTGVVGELVSGRNVAQSFRSSNNLLCAIELFTATYCRINETRVTFSLRRDTPDGEELARATVPATSLRDNEWTRFEFDPILISEGKTFVVQVHSDDAVPGHAVTIYYDDGCRLENGQLWIAGSPQPGALRFRTYFLRRTDLIPAARRTEQHRAAAIPVLALDPGPVIASQPDDVKVSEIVRTIQRINREKIDQVRQLQHIIHEQQTHIHHLETYLSGVTGSRSWRTINRLRRMIRMRRRPASVQAAE